ncbi:MAG TPA: ATP-grasp domain-containing protein [Bryobacterales bacterium]|jgi:predicted ATP-grasp superfamily ATP-dependent carboligase|nr:ATP-grasp domain-containing protein [Bryobacterales bacterium]
MGSDADSRSGPILVLSGTKRVVITIARSLARHGIPVHTAGFDSSGGSPTRSRFIQRHFSLPDFRRNPDLFRERLLALIDRYSYKTLLPAGDDALVSLGPVDAELRRRVRLLCPPPDIAGLVLDKPKSLALARECGLRTPAQFCVDGQRLEDFRHILPFPLVAKPANKARNQQPGSRRIEDFEDLRQTILANPRFCEEWVLQEYCSGFGVGVEVLLWDNEPLIVFQHRRVKELPSSGGVSVKCAAEPPDPELAEGSVRLLRRLGWQGVAMVEYRFDPATRSAVFMEINGRFWGSLSLPVHAGVDFPYYLWELAHQRRPQMPARYPPGVCVMWRAGDCLRLLGLLQEWRAGRFPLSKLWREIGRFGADFFSPVTDAVWSLSDPWPAISEFFSLLRLLPFAAHSRER